MNLIILSQVCLCTSSLTFMSRLKSFALHFRSQPFLDFADDNNFVGELEFV